MNCKITWGREVIECALKYAKMNGNIIQLRFGLLLRYWKRVQTDYYLLGELYNV